MQWSLAAATPARLAVRARIILLAAKGKTNKEIAIRLKARPKTVSLWRRRFADRGLAGIEKESPRGGRKGPESRNRRDALVLVAIG
jgi:transposase